MKKFLNRFRPSRTSPRGGRRACLCKDNTYSIECCDGSIHAQGIGSVSKLADFLLQEDRSFLLQENNFKLKL
jgi:hypothetical protein